MGTRNNRKKWGGRRLSVRRRKRESDSVFGDLTVPSLHDVTLKMHRATDNVERALLSFKPINYKQIHKRWKNKKYRIVSGGTFPASADGSDPVAVPDPAPTGSKYDKINVFERELDRLKTKVTNAQEEVTSLKTAENTAKNEVNEDEDSCVKKDKNPLYTLKVNSDKSFVINQANPPNDYNALMIELAASGNREEQVVDEEAPAVNENVKKNVKNDADMKIAIEEKKPILSSATATTVDAAAAAAGVAGAAAAAALFTDDHTPVIISPVLSDFTIDPNTVTIDGPVPTITKPGSNSEGAITYVSNNTGVATIDANTGVIAINSIGDVTFTAKQEAKGNYGAAEVRSNPLNVIPKVESGEPPKWAALKARWIKINAISNKKYTDEMKQNASQIIEIKRSDVYNWLTTEPLDTISKFHLNLDLYNAILEWLIRWDEFGGKIRTIVSIRGGQPLSGGAAANIPTILDPTMYNKTKVKFDSSLKEYKEPDQIARIRKSIGIEDHLEYGYFYTGFGGQVSGIDQTNADRYDKGKFAEMITTLEGGGNVGIFGYGYSGSGKTYTLTNFEEGKPDANGIAIKLIESLIAASYTITLTITEIYCNKVKPDRSDKEKIVIDEKEKVPYPSTVNKIQISTVPNFTKAIDAIKKIRVDAKRIKYTLNNPESSRGHLFYTFSLTKSGKTPGKLTICDMGGRENPIELSETSYMIIEDDSYNKSNNLRQLMNERKGITNDMCINESYVGKIAERKGNMLRFYVKNPNDDTKWLANQDGTLIFQHVKLEFVNDEKDTYGNPVGKNAKRITGAFIKDSETSHCDSLLKSTFGSFFTSSQEITEDFVRTRLNITKEGKKPPGIQADEAQRVRKITESLITFIDCCKEGIYINETINHLVAYVNFLSNVGDYLNNVVVAKAVIPLNEHVPGYSAVQAVYHPERHMYDPRSFIKSQYLSSLRGIMSTDKYEKIVSSNDDDVGIMTELEKIKNPIADAKNPSMLCFIACINYDNAETKNKIATRNTLEFAMSVSASNGPPEKMAAANPKFVPAVTVPFTTTPKEQNLKVTRPDLIRLAIEKSTLSTRIKKATSGDAKIEAIRIFASNNDGQSEYYKILKSNGRYDKGGIDVGQTDYIIKAFIVEYMNRGNISKVLTQYTEEKNRKLVKAATPLAKGGARTRRKRESMREKKNRITRRRNRV